MGKSRATARGRAQMIKDLLAELFGGFTTVGITALIVRFLWEKIWSLAYDAIKGKIEVDIASSKAEFENRLEKQLKRVEQRLEIASHMVKEKYDTEKSAYNKISEHLSECTSSIQILKNKLQGEVVLSEIALLQKAVLDDIAIFEKNYETISYFIPNEVVVSLRQYSVSAKKLVSMPIPSTCRFDNGERQEAEQRLKEAFNTISNNKEAIQNCIRSRLESFGQFTKELVDS